MRTAVIGRLGSLGAAIASLLNLKQKPITTPRHADRALNPRLALAPLRWKVWRRDDGGPIFGPVSVPSGEYAWVSRQTCRHRLRAITFDFISKQQPLWSRRDRRRWSRAKAGLEYIQLMEDRTNMIENEKALVA